MACAVFGRHRRGGSDLNVLPLLVCLVTAAVAMVAIPVRASDPGLETFEPVDELRPAPLPVSHRTESVADGATIYRNEGNLFKSSSNPNPVLEDVTLASNGQPLEIRSLEFAYYVNVSDPLLIEVRFWDAFDPAASPVNSGLLGMEPIDLGPDPHPTGGFLLGPVFLSAPIPVADPDLAIQFDFKKSTNGQSLRNNVTILFSGTGVTVGSSPDRYYRDVNGNGQFDSNESKTFGGVPDLANFHFHVRGAPDPYAVDPGIDLYQTPSNGTSFLGFDLGGIIGPGFFDFDDGGADCSNGLGSSDPFAGDVGLRGVPLTAASPSLGVTDTIVRRELPASLPAPGSSASIPVKIAALSLESRAAITVTRGGGASFERWSLRVCLSDYIQATGTMVLTKGQCTDEGGTFTATIPVLPKLIFTRLAPSPPCNVTFDYGPLGLPPLLFETARGHWLTEVPFSLGLVDDVFGGNQVDGNCDGILDPDPLPPTTAFHPGTRIARSPADPTCSSPPPAVARLTPFTQDPDPADPPEGGLGLIPTVLSQADVDLDFVPDVGDNCTALANSAQVDADEDAAGDPCDPCPLDPADDQDGDGRCANADNCPATPNPLQSDLDRDGLGDACDPDDDGDGVEDGADNCPAVPNPSQTDRDGDARGDECDLCPDDPANDADGDDICGNLDNCPLIGNTDQTDADSDGDGDVCDNCPQDRNPDQADLDSDAQGDACDPDDDADGAPDIADNCPMVANADQADADADAWGDACDPCPLDPANDADADTVCGNVDNCPIAPNSSQENSDSDSLGDACDNCTTIPNADQTNADGDAFGDACDPCPLDAQNDSDSDSVCGDVDNCPLIANTDQANADGDNFGDACDPCPEDSLNDVDADQACGNVDNCPVLANPDQANSDGDALGDACDPCPGDVLNDVDADQVCGDTDNCPSAANTNQENSDGDAFGDACDPCPLDAQNDSDSDSVCGDVDNCPLIANTDQANADGDGFGDACDACLADPTNDADLDGICGLSDNCPSVANTGQSDVDGDLLGDVCDPCPSDATNDQDGDGVCGLSDNCPVIPNPDQTNADFDLLGDPCDPCPADASNDIDGDSICGLSDNCPSVANADQADGDSDGLGDSCDCDAGDPTNPSLPGETGPIVFGANKGTLTWTAAPLATVHDLVRGRLGIPVPGAAGVGEICFGGLEGVSFDDFASPALEEGFWYLVGGRNACGRGSYGFAATNGVATEPRTVIPCP